MFDIDLWTCKNAIYCLMLKSKSLHHYEISEYWFFHFFPWEEWIIGEISHFLIYESYSLRSKFIKIKTNMSSNIITESALKSNPKWLLRHMLRIFVWWPWIMYRGKHLFFIKNVFLDIFHAVILKSKEAQSNNLFFSQ